MVCAFTTNSPSLLYDCAQVFRHQTFLTTLSTTGVRVLAETTENLLCMKTSGLTTGTTSVNTKVSASQFALLHVQQTLVKIIFS